MIEIFSRTFNIKVIVFIFIKPPLLLKIRGRHSTTNVPNRHYTTNIN